MSYCSPWWLGFDDRPYAPIQTRRGATLTSVGSSRHWIIHSSVRNDCASMDVVLHQDRNYELLYFNIRNSTYFCQTKSIELFHILLLNVRLKSKAHYVCEYSWENAFLVSWWVLRTFWIWNFRNPHASNFLSSPSLNQSTRSKYQSRRNWSSGWKTQSIYVDSVSIRFLVASYSLDAKFLLGFTSGLDMIFPG